MSNSASKFGQHETVFRQEVRGAFQRVQRFIEGVLKEGVEHGEVTTDDSPRILAQYVVTALSGVRIMVKGGMKQTAMRAAVDIILRALTEQDEGLDAIRVAIAEWKDVAVGMPLAEAI